MPQPTLAEVFAAHWPAYAQANRARVAAPHYRAARAILACRKAERGMVWRVCAECGAAQVAPLSCGHRACPQCGTAQARQWEARRAAKLLPVPHFLVTLTVPEELRPLLRGKTGYDAMFRAAAVALRQSVGTHLGGEPSRLAGGEIDSAKRNPKGCDAVRRRHSQPGWTSVLHTWTRQLAAHPHLHLIVAGCVVSKEGALRRVKRCDYLVPHALLAARWRDALRDALQAAAVADPALAAPLAQIPAATWTRRWVVDLQPVGSGEKALTYLARYVQKTALDHARLVRFDAKSATIAWRERPKHPGDRRGLARQTRLTSTEFLRRFLQHILPSGFQRVRHGGFYSAAAKEKYSRLAALLGHHAPPPPAEPWQMNCEQCGGVMEVARIIVGRVTIIPRAAQGRRLAARALDPGAPTLERAP